MARWESHMQCATGSKIMTELEPDRIGIILAGTGPEPDRNRTGLQARKIYPDWPDRPDWPDFYRIFKL